MPCKPQAGGYDPLLTALCAAKAPTTMDRPVVMVVDDEPELRTLLGEYFARHGFTVRTAEDAVQARALVAERAPDVALLDINMPGETGLSLARWLRDAHPRTGIVMLTTAGEAIDRIVGLELGADDYVPKPFDLRVMRLRRKIERNPDKPEVLKTVRNVGYVFVSQ